MADLRVTVRFYDSLVEDMVVPVRAPVTLGEAAQARVAFPGASITVQPSGGELRVLGRSSGGYRHTGRSLAQGQQVALRLGHTEVRLEHLATSPRVRELPARLDFRFLLLLLGVTSGAMWADLGRRLLDDPRGVPALQALTSWRDAAIAGPTRLGEERTAALQPPAGDAPEAPHRVLPDGPPALADDASTGWAYAEWYRAVMPDRRPPVGSGRSDDLAERFEAARAAYDADLYEEAMARFEGLVAERPQDVAYLEGLALACERAGWHRRQLDVIAGILEQDARHLTALGSRAAALARLGRLDEADGALAAASAVFPDHPYLRVYEAKVAALAGLETEALGALEDALSRRGAMSDRLQLELRRDLALDPAFAGLRSDPRLRTMLVRHLGAAAPRPHR